METTYQEEMQSAEEQERELADAARIRLEEPAIIKKIINRKGDHTDGS